MEGYLMVNEDRQVIEQMKQTKINTLAQIEKNQKTEAIIDKSIDISKNIVTIAGTSLTIVLAICPIDGPVGEILTGISTPAIVGTLEASRGLLKSMLVSHDTKELSAALVDVYGNAQKIKLTDKDIVKNVEKKQENKNINPSTTNTNTMTSNSYSYNNSEKVR